MDMHVSWSGPHAWPRFESANGLSPLPSHSGVYLLSFEHQDGNILYAAGLTGGPFRERFVEHTREYMASRYTILDPIEARNGVRSEVWHGWGEARKPERRAEWETRRVELQGAARQQLAEFRVFVADVQPKRVQERLEAAIMNRLYCDGAPLPDRGMFRAPRLEGEEPISIRNTCTSKLYGLPEQLWI